MAPVAVAALTGVLGLAARLRLDPTRHDVMTGECRPENEPSFPLRARSIHFKSRSDVSTIPRCNLISRRSKASRAEQSRRESREGIYTSLHCSGPVLGLCFACRDLPHSRER